jgi:multicomponent Na+:H+ antiporter subunit F
MTPWLVGVEVMILIAALLALFRIARGPTVADRVAALDFMATLIVGFIALQVMESGRGELLDVAIALGLVAFLATVGFGFLIQKREEGA